MLIGARETLGPRSEPILLLHAPGVAERGVDIGIVGSEGERSIEHDRSRRESCVRVARERASAHEQLVCLNLAGRHRRRASRRRREGELQTLRDRGSDLILHGEDVDQLAVVALGPELISVGHRHELRRDSDAASRRGECCPRGSSRRAAAHRSRAARRACP